MNNGEINTKSLTTIDTIITKKTCDFVNKIQFSVYQQIYGFVGKKLISDKGVVESKKKERPHNG